MGREVGEVCLGGAREGRVGAVGRGQGRGGKGRSWRENRHPAYLSCLPRYAAVYESVKFDTIKTYVRSTNRVQKNWKADRGASQSRRDGPTRPTQTVALPSTSDVRRVTLAAFLRPAGRLSPIFSSLSLRMRPPFLLLALRREGGR